MAKGIKKALWIVGCECTNPAREEEFNRWYKEVHLPDLKEASGGMITGVRRYKSVQLQGLPKYPENQQYLHVYELNTDNPAAMLYKVDAQVSDLVKRGRIIDCIQHDWMAIYEFVEEL